MEPLALPTPPPSTTTAKTRPARLALSLHDAGSSGVIDVADLRADPMPWSLAPPGSSPPTPTSTTTPSRGPSRTTLVGMVSALAAGTAALALVALSPTPTIVVQDTPSTERQLSMQEVEAPRELDVIEHGEDETPPPEVLAAVMEAESDNEATPTKATAPKKKATTSKRRTSKKKTSRKAKTTSKSSSKSTASTLPVECVLDPAACDSGNRTGSSASGGKASAKALPSKLSASQLRSGLASSKASARQCGPEHGADAGARVQVKLSIAGADGSVVSASALGEHADTSLGACVARALSRADFPSFTAPRMGMVYTVRL